MAYSTNPNLPKARTLGRRLLVLERLPVQTVSNRCGVHHSTIWRWKQKWDKLNEHVQFTNDNRPNRRVGMQPRLAYLHWLIPTCSSRPRTRPSAIAAHIVEHVLALRARLKRCADAGTAVIFELQQ